MPDCSKCLFKNRDPNYCIYECVSRKGNLSNHGRTVVSIDSGKGQTLPEVEAAMAAAQQDRADIGLPPDEAEIQVRVLQSIGDALKYGQPVDIRRTIETLERFADLTGRELSLLFRMMGVRNVNQAARELRISHQAAYKTAQRIIRKHPEFRYLFK